MTTQCGLPSVTTVTASVSPSTSIASGPVKRALPISTVTRATRPSSCSSAHVTRPPAVPTVTPPAVPTITPLQSRAIFAVFAFVEELGEDARSVPALLSLTAVGVVDADAEVRIARGRHGEDAVRTDAAVAVADEPHRLRREDERQILRIDDDVIVAEPVRPHVVRHEPILCHPGGALLRTLHGGGVVRGLLVATR